MRSRWMAWLVALLCSFGGAVALAQNNNAPVIRSLTVAQVPELVPGTELVFRASGTAGGTLSLHVDGVAGMIVLPEGSAGSYAGAYTISIRDKIGFESKVNATLKVGDRQTAVQMAQSILTNDSQARAVAAASPTPLINRVETKNTGALSGGNEVTFMVSGTAGGKASVSMDNGKTTIPLAENAPGQYSANYTIKTRDQWTDATPVNVALALGDKHANVSKPLASGVYMPQPVAGAAASAASAKCDSCGVVQAVNKVKVKGKPNYLGAIAGGVAGAALGTQIGKGDGKTAATVLGAVGGAVAGREVEKQVRSGTFYDVVVKMDDATMRTVRYEAAPAFKPGSKVKFSGETLVANE